MGDERLRQLERAAAGGDPEAERLLLQARLRRGVLDEERLALAAYVGLPSALALRPHAAGPADFRTWLGGLARWDRAISVRGMRVFVRATLGEPPPASRAAQCASAVDAWLAAPSDGSARAVKQATAALGDAPHDSALRVVGEAVTSYPPLTGSGIPPDLHTPLRESFRATALEVALGDAPLPLTPPPQAMLCQGTPGHVPSPELWRSFTQAGLRVLTQLPHGPFPTYAVWRTGRRERLTVVRLAPPLDLPPWVTSWEACAHPDVVSVLEAGHLAVTSYAGDTPIRPLTVREAWVDAEPLVGWRARAEPSWAEVARLGARLTRAVAELLPLGGGVYLTPAHVAVRPDGSPVLHGLLADALHWEVERHDAPADPGSAFLLERLQPPGLPYFSPEGLSSGSPPNEAATVYRVGCLLYLLLTGKPPFTSRKYTLDVAVAIARGNPSPPSASRPGVPPALERWVLGALATDPARRPASLEALAEALDALTAT